VLGERVLGGVEDLRGGAAGIVDRLDEHVRPHWSTDLVI
jgi:hypothetical protein